MGDGPVKPSRETNYRLKVAAGFLNETRQDVDLER
jgi:hypothetical protein